jgi:homoserine kinase type II
VAKYTKLTSQEIHHLALQYNLSVITSAALEGGAANSSFLLNTAEDQFILTVIDDEPYSDANIIADILIHLEQHDFPTSRLVVATNGKKVTSYKEKPVLVKHYIPGETIFQISDEGLFALGQVLAQLHDIPPPDFVRHELSYGQTYFANAYGLGFDPAYEEWLARQQSDFLAQCPDGLPRSLIHADVFWDNIIYLDGEFKALIDFESVSYYYSVFDVACAISGTCVEVDGILNIKKAAQIVSGYQQIRQLTPGEQGALHLFTLYTVVTISYWRYMKYNLHNPNEEKKYLHREKMALANHIKAIPTAVFNQVLDPVGKID